MAKGNIIGKLKVMMFNMRGEFWATTLFIKLLNTSHDTNTTVPSLRKSLLILEAHQGRILGTQENLSDIQMLKILQNCCSMNAYKLTERSTQCSDYHFMNVAVAAMYT